MYRITITMDNGKEIELKFPEYHGLDRLMINNPNNIIKINDGNDIIYLNKNHISDIEVKFIESYKY